MAGSEVFLSSRAIREVAKALTASGFFGVPRYTTALLPAAPGEGAVAFDTTADDLVFFDGAAWVAAGGGGGSGDVVGPASSTDNAVVRFDGAGGKTIQNGTTTLSDVGVLNLPTAGSVGFNSDTIIVRTAANVAGLASGDWFQSTPGRSRLVSNVTNNTTTMANLTELSQTLIAGRAYSFRLILFVSNSVAAEGVKVDFDGGAATMTSFRAHGTIFDTALLLSTQTTAIATDFAVATVTGAAMVEIYGAMVVNAGGTFIPRVAENAAATGTVTVTLGSHLCTEDMV